MGGEAGARNARGFRAVERGVLRLSSSARGPRWLRVLPHSACPVLWPSGQPCPSPPVRAAAAAGFRAPACPCPPGLPPAARHAHADRRRPRHTGRHRPRLRRHRRPAPGGQGAGTAEGTAGGGPRPRTLHPRRVRPGRRRTGRLLPETQAARCDAQAVTDPAGQLLQLPSALPGRPPDLTAARAHNILRSCERTGRPDPPPTRPAPVQAIGPPPRSAARLAANPRSPSGPPTGFCLCPGTRRTRSRPA